MNLKRWGIFVAVLGLGMGGLLVRLFWLTVVRGGELRARADGNRVEIRKLQAPRGIIVDRNGEKLVVNVPGEARDEVKRKYVYGQVLAHVLGYVGEISQEEIEGQRAKCKAQSELCLEQGDIVGKMGVEKWLDGRLRGVDGAELIEAGADGEVLRRLGRRDPVAGGEVGLTVDLGLQRKALEVLGGRRGAVVVTTAQGEILALVSSPSFEPEQVGRFLNREDKPLFNRAVGGVYPPGSVFKLVTAVAGLEEGRIDGSTEIEDTGEIKIGKFRYGNWYFDQYGRKEGFLNIVGALRRSNDIFFYRVGQLLGAEKLADWARRFGLGQRIGLEWAAEASGLVPDPEWKEKVKGERWFLGNTYHMAIGQGDMLVTPLQVNLMTGAVATGRLCKPTIVEDEKLTVQDCEDLGISRQTLDLVRQGMEAACSEGGTAFPFFGFEPQVACKTGTAQHGGKETLPHAWLTLFAPSNGPEVVVTVLLEAAGEGSYEAGPAAREILDYWFYERRGR